MWSRCLILIAVVILCGCSMGGRLKNTKAETGLGSSPFTTGGSYTAAQANAINDAINDNSDEIADNAADIALRYLKTEIDTQAEVEAIWGVDLLTLTGDGTGLTLDIADCDSGTCTADEMLDSVNVSPASGSWDLSQLTLTFPSGGWYFEDDNTAPTITGQFLYDNDVAGLDDGALCWYDDDEVKYIPDYTTLPNTTGQILEYNATSDKWVPRLNVKTIGIAASDETTDLTTGTSKATFRMPWGFTLLAVRANVNTAPIGSTIIVDINETGSSILSTKLSIDASEKTSTTAASAVVISDPDLGDDNEITIDIDQIGSSTAGKGLKIWLLGVDN